jgi:hypothetical protein
MMFATLVSSAFFVALAFGLLVRYRQVSQRVNTSTDLGRDLWQALEQRLKKQDERILDMMGRFDVIQSRASERLVTPVPRSVLMPVLTEEKSPPAMDMTVMIPQPKSRIVLDETELSVIKLLSVKPRSSVEVKDLIGRTREHAARLMKILFDLGLVSRNTSKKPFVYQLTETGRRYLSAS